MCSSRCSVVKSLLHMTGEGEASREEARLLHHVHKRDGIPPRYMFPETCFLLTSDPHQEKEISRAKACAQGMEFPVGKFHFNLLYFK